MDKVKRLEWIDYTKGFAIILVVVAHTMGGLRNANLPFPEAYNIAIYIIYTFHMPLFFFISGYLSKRIITQPFNEFMKSTAISIIIPYTIWSIMFISINGVLGSANNQLEIGDIELIFLPQGIVSVYWFFYCMFFVKLCYLIIGKAEPTLVAPFAAFALVMYLSYFVVRQFSPEMLVGAFTGGFFVEHFLMANAFFGAGLIAALKANFLNLAVSPRLLGFLVRRLDGRDD